jgi:hypothetical protein
MCAVRLFASRLGLIDRLVKVRTVTSSPMYSTSFGPTRSFLTVFAGDPIGFGNADAFAEGAGFPGSGFGMDVNDRCSIALAVAALGFAPGNAEAPTVVAGWDGL